MSRIAPPLPEDLSTARKTVPWEREIEVQLITRLFGGGARPREIDERSWIRPAALKSALRFWWRATHAHLPEYDSLKKLKKQEDLLFGTAARFGKKNEILGGPGWLSVEVSAAGGSLVREAYDPKSKAEAGRSVGIAYYPATPQKEQVIRLGGVGKGKGVRSLIRLRLERLDQDAVGEIQEALKAFLLMGGVGARTRRGAGSLAPAHEEADIPCSALEIERYFAEWVKIDPSSIPAGVFSLARAQWVVTGRSYATGEEAQEALLDVLREFRQKRLHPKNWGKGDYGPTRWPEPYAIRMEVGTGSHKTSEEHREQFPRGILGLPIVFKFHDKDKNDPGRHTLAGVRENGEAISRFASPLLLRPIRIWRQEKGESVKEYLPVALFTEPILPSDTLPLLEPTPAEEDPRPTLSEARTFSETSFAEAAKNADLLAKLKTAFQDGLR
ncbi:MAG: RAMP superfamily CRISPR-associated protein [Acidobacteriota bacterium]